MLACSHVQHSICSIWHNRREVMHMLVMLSHAYAGVLGFEETQRRTGQHGYTVRESRINPLTVADIARAETEVVCRCCT